MTELELEQVLEWHIRRYPLMQPIDALKLLYQGEFGGGHLIRDPDTCLQGLREEYAHTEQVQEASLLEPLNGDVMRVNLAALEGHGLSVEKVFQAFLASSEAIKGSMEHFGRAAVHAAPSGWRNAASIYFGGFDDQLFPYIAQGFPPCSHSEQYRVAYHPAYRVVLRSLLGV